tara:strand:- start:524 stop:967 length:444 start_codon:yes stop_codon:yes gene_type:complete
MLTIEHRQIEIESKTTESPELKPGLQLHFESGLLGFEANKEFELIQDQELHPYQWLKGLDADQSFLVIPPSMAVGNYGVEIADDDAVLLNLKDPSDAGMLCIATYHPNETVTINLKGPIVYNKKTGHARQVVPLNAASLSLSHPMGN